ncbi:MAG: methionyl-tRNA formyltransferase [Alphaproteobacteria bacterium]|nr:MAG: methionyl-tRNA formyltransferase [Alphaproteobacteria bacterium]
MRIIFMGTPDFAVPALQTLIDSDHEVVAVYSQPPRPKGRGMQVQKSPVHILADTYGIDVHTPKSLKDKHPDDQDIFVNLNADIAVVAAYGLILPTRILEAPKYGCINIHASLLPKWRGASPIQHAIWKGDTKSGVTIMQMELGLDTGPMILKGETDITPTTSAQELHDTLSNMGGGLLVSALDQIKTDGKVSGEKQDDAHSTYAPMLKKTDGEIDPSASAVDIDQQIRALNPWPGTYITGLKGRVKVLDAHIDEGILIYDRVQPEGKKPMDIKSAQNGGYL